VDFIFESEKPERNKMIKIEEDHKENLNEKSIIDISDKF
jgi:hypothetical protein